MRILVLVTAILIGHQSFGQYASGKTLPDSDQKVAKDFEDMSYRLSTTISGIDLQEHLKILASDEFEGRETGTPGNDRAAKYLAGEFAKLGLTPLDAEGSYFQKVAFTFTTVEKSKLNINGEEYKFLKDYVLFPQQSLDLSVESNELVFLGFGIDDDRYSDYGDHDLRGKVIIAFEGEPVDNNGISKISNSKELSKWSIDWKNKSEAAKNNGAKALILIANDLKDLINENRRSIVNRVVQLGDFSSTSPKGVNTLFLSSKIAETLLGQHKDEIIKKREELKSGNNVQFYTSIGCEFKQVLRIKRNVIESNNVAGMIPGTSFKDEVLVVSAHFDHVGNKGKEVYNGADDNSSGTSTVLEIAEAMAISAKLKNGPKRSVLFLLVTGEEKGLLGSQYYTSNPYFPIDKTMANVNIDMVGRWGAEYPEGGQEYIYVIGSDRISQELHDINEELNQQYSHLQLDYKYNDEKDPNRFYFRSDHYNFAKHGIPSIFFFNGVHEDYHRISDTIDKIDFSLMEKRAKHIFHLVWNLGNKEEFLTVNTTTNSAG